MTKKEILKRIETLEKSDMWTIRTERDVLYRDGTEGKALIVEGFSKDLKKSCSVSTEEIREVLKKEIQQEEDDLKKLMDSYPELFGGKKQVVWSTTGDVSFPELVSKKKK